MRSLIIDRLRKIDYTKKQFYIGRSTKNIDHDKQLQQKKDGEKDEGMHNHDTRITVRDIYVHMRGILDSSVAETRDRALSFSRKVAPLRGGFPLPSSSMVF